MRTLTQGPYSVRNKGSWLYFHLGIQLPSLSRRSGPCRSYVARAGVVARGMQPSITWPPVNLGYCLNTDSKCLKWDALWFQQLHDSYRSYHVMGPTHDNFVKVFNEKRVHQLHVQMRCSLTTRYFILSHWNITHTPPVAIVWSHHFTTRTSWNTHNTTFTTWTSGEYWANLFLKGSHL